MSNQETPAMQQYLRFKQEHPDAILLFRMGDFYETFYEDAHEASRLLGLTLTRRNNGKSDSVPLAGLPYHALDAYLARLVRAGRKVAICEQMEAPQKGKKVVRREVVQVVSPGTVLSDDLLDHRRNNYLAGLCATAERAGLAVADLSTGVFRAMERTTAALWETLSSLGPAEVVAPASWCEAHDDTFAEKLPGILLTRADDWSFSRAYALESLTKHFRTASLKGFGVDGLDEGLCAAGGVLAYLKENQKGTVPHLTRLQAEPPDLYMVLDTSTQRNLELSATLQEGRREGTLLSVLDLTKTSPGARMLRAWLFRPLLSVEAINERLDAVEELVRSGSLREDVRTALGGVGDLERLMAKVCCGRAGPRDLVALRRSIEAVPALREHLSGAGSALLRETRRDGLPDLSEVSGLVALSIADEPPATAQEGSVIRQGYHAGLDEIREIAAGGRSWVARLQAQEREATGIGSLKVGYNRAFGYYIEVSQANLARVPGSYIRKQTLVNAERFITPELKDREALILGADERAHELERALFEEVRGKVATFVEGVQKTAESVARVDVLAGFAEAAARNDYVRPALDTSFAIQIEAGRHPVVERLLPAGGFVANDVLVDGEKDQILLITGPNMAGKSTILRQVGLIVLLAQVGSFVPARAARIGVADRIFTRVGASDNLARGESTFLVEMNEAANILNNATPRSLVLLDEIGRGTSTFDGLSIAWAMTEHLHGADGVRPRTLFATHYHELTELSDVLPRVRNYSVAVQETGEEIVFLHRLVPGGCDHSYGIEVARLAGMPPALIARAKEVLDRLEQNDLSMVRSAARRSRKLRRSHGQLGLFGSEPTARPDGALPDHPVVEVLRNLEVDQLTPVEALMRLDELRKQAMGVRGEPTIPNPKGAARES